MAGHRAHAPTSRNVHGIAFTRGSLFLSVLLLPVVSGALVGYKDWQHSGTKLQTLYQSVGTHSTNAVVTDGPPIYPVFRLQLAGEFTREQRKHIYAAASLASLYISGSNTTVPQLITIEGTPLPSSERTFASIVLATTFGDDTIEIYTAYIDSAEAGLIIVVLHELLHALGFNYRRLQEAGLLTPDNKFNGTTVATLLTLQDVFIDATSHWTTSTVLTSGWDADLMHPGLHDDTQLSVATFAVLKDLHPDWQIRACFSHTDCRVLDPQNSLYCYRFHPEYPGRCQTTLAPLVFTQHTSWIVNTMALVFSGGLLTLRSIKYN